MSQLLNRDKPTPLNAALGLNRGWRGWPRRAWLAGAGVLGMGLVAYGGSPSTNHSIIASPIRSAQAAVPTFHADCSARPDALQQQLNGIAQGFDGKVGIAVSKAGCDWVVGARLKDYFPQQSVSKLWVSLSVLDAVDKGRMRLDQELTIRPNDLVVFNQPLRWQLLEKGSLTLPVEQLMTNALSLSDNLSNDRLLWTVGGPDKVRATLADKGIEGIRFGPGERLLQSRIAGLTWHQDLAEGNNFNRARTSLPLEQRKTALANYVADPMDGARPEGMARALAMLAAGQLLSPGSTEVMLSIMGRAHSGPMRLKAGAPRGWKVYHKTGTGQELAGISTGYNDVGLLEAPDGSIYSIAVLIGETRQPIPVRMKMMQSVSRAVAQFHENSDS